MGIFRKLFRPSYRKACKCEARGAYRDAAALYVESGDPGSAAGALLTLAARSEDFETRLQAYHDALRWLPITDSRRKSVQMQIGILLFDRGRDRGVQTDDDRRQMQEAAQVLEQAEQWVHAADAWELLGRREELLRCLQEGGEVERLEKLLNEEAAEEDRERQINLKVREYEMAMTMGARIEAWDALQEAHQEAHQEDANNVAVADLIRRLECKRLCENRVELRIGTQRMVYVGRFPARVGRGETDIVLRGSSVSREHAEIDRSDTGFLIRDLDSRNGTLFRGIAIAGSLPLDGVVELGFGDDVQVQLQLQVQPQLQLQRQLEPHTQVQAQPASDCVSMKVIGGLDCGLEVFVGQGTLPIPGTSAVVDFAKGQPRLRSETGLELNGQRCKAAVVLLRGDQVKLGDTLIEVPA